MLIRIIFHVFVLLCLLLYYLPLLFTTLHDLHVFFFFFNSPHNVWSHVGLWCVRVWTRLRNGKWGHIYAHMYTHTHTHTHAHTQGYSIFVISIKSYEKTRSICLCSQSLVWFISLSQWAPHNKTSSPNWRQYKINETLVNDAHFVNTHQHILLRIIVNYMFFVLPIMLGVIFYCLCICFVQ